MTTVTGPTRVSEASGLQTVQANEREETAMPPSDPKAVREALAAVKKAMRQLERADAARDRAREAVNEAIRAAAAVPGVSKESIISTTGYARQTVYDALKPPAGGASS